MRVHVALVCALEIPGEGKLSMRELRMIGSDIGLRDVASYIQSGNLVFRDESDSAEVAAMLDIALGIRMGRAPGVMVRSPAELRAVIADNPFAGMDQSRVSVSFFSRRLPADALNGIMAPGGEEAIAAEREIYVHYPLGSDRHRFSLPILERGTPRSIETIIRLADLGRKLEAKS
ncbi:DUF1697 domain-containing protein [Ciceribacter sp. L1K22]|uniref:DUF1697 domain-containing protein n=1 Tax=Ciceribacter sp. L1K22 TaxID=2820275 RepID=UPI001ABEA838|nr:DUF1697 domain-containing protein [Ciceribacter sp. L1K22]MBO3759327.1 DUF1697 domain-containing protein [Ciceribacter sp. L1K22]